MTELQIKAIYALLIASAVCVCLPLLFRLLQHILHKNRAKHKINTMLWFSVGLIASIWCLRFAVGYYSIFTAESSAATLTWWEEIFNSLSHALQTFSLDEDYTEYILTGKAMLRELGGNDTFLPALYGVWASVLNFIAPVAGGAIIFEILASVFPKIKLRIFYLEFWRDKVFFSKLNEGSLALAQSYLENSPSKFRRPVIIFTDAYIDKEEEKSSELLIEAKLLGAICTRDDLSHIAKNSFGKRIFFVIDNDEAVNFQTLISLANKTNRKYIKNSTVCFFVEDDAYIQIEQRVRDILATEPPSLVKKVVNVLRKKLRGKESPIFFQMAQKTLGKQKSKKVSPFINKFGDEVITVLKEEGSMTSAQLLHFLREIRNISAKSQKENANKTSAKIVREALATIKTKALPTFIPVQISRNLVSNMLVEVPLYEPLINKERNQDGTVSLTVTILGAGIFGTQMFLSAYWFGQLLDCDFTINVVSQETEDYFWSKIDYVNPEIRHTTIERDPLLRINDHGEYAKPYCTVKYHQYNAKSTAFIEQLYGRSERSALLDTDYFFVALGADADNLSVANTLQKYVGQQHVEQNDFKKVVIAYVIQNPNLSATLNQKKLVSSAKEEKDIYMYAAGSLKEVYSTKNVLMTKFGNMAQKEHDSYLSKQRLEDVANEHRKRLLDDYEFWASNARAMHTKYKIFSLGLITKSPLFDNEDTFDVDYNDSLQEAFARYHQITTQNMQDKEMHRMAWLEHRRWNAFTRVRGFRQPASYAAYTESAEDEAIAKKENRKMRKHKHMELKLHPCLVECDDLGSHIICDANGKVAKEQDESTFDLLDKLTYDLIKKGIGDTIFKIYDYPSEDRGYFPQPDTPKA